MSLVLNCLFSLLTYCDRIEKNHDKLEKGQRLIMAAIDELREVSTRIAKGVENVAGDIKTLMNSIPEGGLTKEEAEKFKGELSDVANKLDEVAAIFPATVPEPPVDLK